MSEWISVDDDTPEDGQYCRVMFDDESESDATYLAFLGVFCLTGALTSFDALNVTHWKCV